MAARTFVSVDLSVIHGHVARMTLSKQATNKQENNQPNKQACLLVCAANRDTDTSASGVYFPCRAGVGTTGSQQTLFYTEVTDAMRVGKGGGLEEEGEFIEVEERDVEQGRQLILDDKVNRPVGMIFALQWFFATKWNNVSGSLL